MTPLENTSIALSMEKILGDKKRSSSQKNTDSKKELHLASPESTQIADDDPLANAADPLNKVSDTCKEATVVLGSTKTILSNQAGSKENIKEPALKENVSEQYSSFQDEGIFVPEDKSTQPDDEQSLDSNETNNIGLENSNNGVISNLSDLQEESSKKLSSHEANLAESDLPDSTKSLPLSDFMEHVDGSSPQIEEPLEASSNSSTPLSPSERSQIHTPSSPNPSIPSVSPLSNSEESHQNLSARAILERADQLKIAQDRIKELENVVFSLRQENTGLSSEIETHKQRIEDLSSMLDATERKNRTKVEGLSDERNLLEESLFQKNKDYNNLKLKIEELKKRLAKDLKSVRVREIELENRLELVKQEKTALLKNKDEIILNLKRKTDHLTTDIDGYRKKNQSAQIQISETEDRVQRSVRALRLALGMLEGSDILRSDPPGDPSHNPSDNNSSDDDPSL